MTACLQWQPLLSDAAHDDLTDTTQREAFESHLAGCAGCQEELHAQTTFLTSMVLPSRPAAGELNAWREVGPEVYKTTPKRFVFGFPLVATLAFAMLVTGIGIGRLFATQSGLNAPINANPELATGSEGNISGDSATAQEDEYVKFLESSAPLLLAIANRQTGALVSARYAGQSSGRNEPQAAALLAMDADVLATELTEQKRDREAELVRELELVFLQIANLSHPTDEAGLRLLQAAITDRALLFQLSVEELRHLPHSRPEGA